MTVDYAGFRKRYLAATDDVFSHWTRVMQQRVASHNAGWSPDRYDMANYLRRSSLRYFHAYRALARGPDRETGRLCDVGGFFGAFPVTLARMGYDVTMTEALALYDGAFEPLFEFVRSEGVHIVELDPFDPAARPPGSFDGVFLIAMLEHYPHSLRVLLDNIKAMLGDGARLYIEVPNIAYWPWRMKLLRGESPLVPATDIYDSAVPFTGHHHEFTLSELRDLLDLAGFDVVAEMAFNYSLDRPRRHDYRKHPVSTLLQRTAFRWFPSTRELLGVTATANPDA